MVMEKKEATILGLSEQIGAQIRDLQGRLDNRFYRLPQPETEAEGRNVVPNVLDEIIENLEADRTHLDRITCFINDHVLPKIN